MILPIAASAILAFAIASPAFAQAYPSKAARIIVPFPAGGAVDQLARTLAQRMTTGWGQPVVVENRAGGGGIIGTDVVAKAAPDGYTMGVVANSFTIQPLLQAKMPYDVFKDLQPVIIAAWTPHIFVVHPSLPVRSIKELIEHARANPGRVSFASAGPGTGQHLAGELFKSAVNVDLVHIPYQGSAPAVTAMLGGHVGMMIGALPDVLPHVQAGKMRAIAVAMDRRADAMKDLPTVSEAGVKGFDSWSWFGIVTAASVPREIVNRIAAEMNRQLRSPEVRERLDALALYYMDSSPEEFGAILRENYTKYARIIKTANIKID